MHHHLEILLLRTHESYRRVFFFVHHQERAIHLNLMAYRGCNILFTIPLSPLIDY